MMKRFNCPSSRCCFSLKDVGLLLLRWMVGVFMLTHGIPKMMNFDALSQTFPSVLGLSASMGLLLIIFAEVFASVLLLLGLFTRLATIPLIIGLGVAAFVVHAADPFAAKELALVYLIIYLVLLLTGPGKIALDRLIYNRFCPNATQQGKTCSMPDSEV